MSLLSVDNQTSRSLTRRGLLAGFVVGASALVACSGGGAATPAASSGGAASTTASVTMSDANKFDPASVTITKGGSVTWTNNSGAMQHSVTFDPVKAVNKSDAALPDGVAAFDSGLLNPAATFSHTFAVVGTYKYFCIPHESLGMTGTVVVQ